MEGSAEGFLCIFGEHFSSLGLASDRVPFASRASGMAPQIVDGDCIRETPRKALCLAQEGNNIIGKHCAVESALS